MVVAERFERQRQQHRALFGKHRCDLAFGGPVNACVGPTLLPAVQIRLGFFQTLEAQPFERRLLRVAHSGFHFALAVWILYAAGQGDDAVMGQHVAVQRIKRGIVDVRREHALAQIRYAWASSPGAVTITTRASGVGDPRSLWMKRLTL